MDAPRLAVDGVDEHVGGVAAPAVSGEGESVAVATPATPSMHRVGGVRQTGRLSAVAGDSIELDALVALGVRAEHHRVPRRRPREERDATFDVGESSRGCLRPGGDPHLRGPGLVGEIRESVAVGGERRTMGVRDREELLDVSHRHREPP